MPPSSLPSIEPAQLLALEVVRNALADAGYAERPFPREQTSVVLGMGGGAAQLAMGFAFRSYLPMLDTVLPEAGRQAMESLPGFAPGVDRGFVPRLPAQRHRRPDRQPLEPGWFQLHRRRRLRLVAGGRRPGRPRAGNRRGRHGRSWAASTRSRIRSPISRSARPRHSRRAAAAARSTPSADGIVISEGVAALVLKRLADAERDGDRIYAVIKGVGASSDGRARGLTAPVVDGQMRALERAYTKAGSLPQHRRLRRGSRHRHRLGRRRRDRGARTTLQATQEPRPAIASWARSSRRSAIPSAPPGLAGLINASLTLFHKVLPPTIGIETPNPNLDLRDGPFRLCTEAQPWLHAHADRPRRAGVSAFGFGGTNFHAVLEAYDKNVATAPRPATATGRQNCSSGGLSLPMTSREARRARCRLGSRRGPISATSRTPCSWRGKARRRSPHHVITLAWHRRHIARRLP